MGEKRAWSVKHIILGVAIALLSVFFFAYAVQTLYPAPKYSNYCDSKPNINLNNKTSCINAGGKWTSLNTKAGAGSGYCQNDFSCNEEYKNTAEVYERNIFFVYSIIAIVIFIIGFFLSIAAVSNGLMGGGVILIFYSTLKYWGNLSDIWRTLILGISLAILIWLGYKKLND